MWCAKKKIWIMGFVLSLLMANVSFSRTTFGISRSKLSSIEISAVKTQIKFGEPLIVNVDLTFAQPRLVEWTGKPATSIRYDVWDLEVQHSDANEPSLFPLLFVPPLRCTLQDANGLEYRANVEVLYHLYEEWPDVWATKVIFDKPGAYTVSLVDSKGKSTNTLKILVEPSVLGQKALSLLTDAKDIIFLLYRGFKNKKTLSHLKEVVNQCEGTLLAGWAAARLGIEEARELEDKYRDNSHKFVARYQLGKVTEPLVNQAYIHLNKALALPDEFAIREEALQYLAFTEIVRGDYQKAISHTNELGVKYPRGEYGKEASASNVQEEILSLQERIIELQRRELEQSKVEIEKLIKWLEEIWLEDESIRETITEEQWLKFIEAIKAEQED